MPPRKKSKGSPGHRIPPELFPRAKPKKTGIGIGIVPGVEAPEPKIPGGTHERRRVKLMPLPLIPRKNRARKR